MTLIKGKGEKRTYWLLGEDKIAHEFRSKERDKRRVSQTPAKDHLSHAIRNTISNGQKSSLKSRHVHQRSSIPRSSSLETPKKLRFAIGSSLELYQHHGYFLNSKNKFLYPTFWYCILGVERGRLVDFWK